MNQINANCEDEIKERFESLSLKIKEEIDLKKLSLTPIKLSIRIPYYGSENKDKNLGVTPGLFHSK